MRILYLQASWVPPPSNWKADRFVLLSERLEGDVLHPIWFHSAEQVKEELGPNSWPEYVRGRFRYHWVLSFRANGKHRRFATFWFYLRKGLELHRRRRYDCIVVYSHMTPALIAILLKLLTRTRVVVEIMTSPEFSYLYEHRRRTMRARAMRLFSDLSLHVTVLLSDLVHLLYEKQLEHYKLLKRHASIVFHDFVPISQIQPSEGKEDVVLQVGAPWYLKGADVLIEAFRKIAAEFPDVTLRLQGDNPGGRQLQKLAEGVPRVEVVRAVANPETIRRIGRSLILVQPSRCEGLSRVLIEAMTAGVSIIASNVGGNPACIEEGQTGLLFASGNVDALAMQLRRLLCDPELRDRLGKRAREVALDRFSEQVYLDQFARMVESVSRRKARLPS